MIQYKDVKEKDQDQETAWRYHKRYKNISSHLLTLQACADEHPKPPPPVQGSEKEIFTETFKAFVNVVEAIIDAVGGTVSAK